MPDGQASASGAEEGPADADHRRPFLDRDLEVVGHAHRQLGEPERGSRLAQRREPPARLAVVGRHRHQAVDREAVARGERVDERGDARRAGSRPSAAPPPRFTSTSTRAPGARRAISAPSSARSTDCHHVDPRRERAHLVALELPEEVPPRRTSGARAASWRAAPGRGSRRGRPRRRDHRLRPASTSTVLVAATSVTSSGVAPGAARRGRRSARAPRPTRGRDRRTAVALRRRRAAHDGRAPPRRPGGRSRRRAGGRSGRATPRCTPRRRRRRRRRPGPARRGRRPGCRARARRRRCARDLGPEPLDQAGQEVGAELVALRVHARPEHRAHRARRHRARRAATASPMTPCSRPGQPACTTPTASRRDQRDRGAVGGEHHERAGRRSR